jgi:hypothetical protein
MSTTGPSNPLAEDAAVVGEESVITVTLIVHQVPKQIGSSTSHDYHTWATSMYSFVLPEDVLEGLFGGLADVLEAEIDKFAKPHPSEQQQLDP